MRATKWRDKMKHSATMMIAAALAVSVSGPADANWKRFWKQAGDKKCWDEAFQKEIKGQYSQYAEENCRG